jgi:hypothetical protein
MSMSLVNCMTLSDVSEIPFVIAGLDPASRVYPTCGALLMCGPRASPRSDAIHLLGKKRELIRKKIGPRVKPHRR